MPGRIPRSFTSRCSECGGGDPGNFGVIHHRPTCGVGEGRSVIRLASGDGLVRPEASGETRLSGRSPTPCPHGWTLWTDCDACCTAADRDDG